MSKYNFNPPADEPGNGHTPINLAIGRLDPRALVVLIENSQSLHLDSVEVSSLWRQNPYSDVHTPIPGRGIDIVAATRDGVTVYFNNSTIGQQSQAAIALRDEIFNSFVNDSRVSQVLGPWKLYRYQGGPVGNNNWQNVVTQHGKTIAEINSMTWAQLNQFRNTLDKEKIRI